MSSSPPLPSTSATNDDEDVLSLLRKHVLDLAPEPSTDQAARDEKFHLLQTKLHTIQHGLVAIEQERKELVDKCRRLESEKAKVRKELENREREIAKLSRRCAEQAEQVKEATLIRREHRDLSSQVQELKHELSLSDVHECGVFKDLKSQLKECQEERDQLQHRLDKLQQDYDKVSDSLQECMQKIANLNGKQQQWQDSQAMHERATNQQRLQHTMVVQRLQRNLTSREAEMERLAQVFKSTQASHERQMEETEGRHQAIVAQLKQETQRLLAEKTQLHQSLQSEFQAKLDRLHAEMKHRDEMIANLENEVEVNLKHLMSTNSSLQRAEEDSRMFLALTADIEALQQEQESLQDQLHDRDTTIAELSAQLIRLEMEQTFGSSEPFSSDPIEAFGSNSETLKHELRDARTTIEQLQDQLDAVQQENQRLTNTFASAREMHCASPAATDAQTEVGSELVVLESQIGELVAEVKMMKTKLALREDEIRELRIVEMPELEEQLVDAKAKLATAEDELNRCRSVLPVPGGSVEHLQVINDLNDEIDKHRELSRSHERQLKEANADVAMLTEQLLVKEKAESKLQRELQQLKAAIKSVRASGDGVASGSADDAHRQVPGSSSIVSGGEDAAHMSSANGEVHRREDHRSLTTFYESFLQKRLQKNSSEEEAARMINGKGTSNGRDDFTQRATDLRDLELKNASLNAKMQRQEPFLQQQLEGSTVLRESSNAFRFGAIAAIPRSGNAGRKFHRPTASEPSFDLAQVHSKQSP